MPLRRRRDARLAGRRDPAARPGLSAGPWHDATARQRARPSTRRNDALAAAAVADGVDRDRPALAQHPGAGAAGDGDRARDRRRTMQLTLSLYLLALAVAQLVLGPLSDRFGRRPVVLAGLALTAVASVRAIVDLDGREPDLRARAAGARRVRRHRGRPRHHPRPVRPRPRRRHDRLVAIVMVVVPMLAPADRRPARHRVRLAIDLRLHRR